MCGKMTFFIDHEDFKHYGQILKTDRELCLEFSVDEGTKLFPTVVTTPSQETLFTMDFTPADGCRPLSTTFIKPPCRKRFSLEDRNKSSSISICPRRLGLMVHSKSQWVRQDPKVPKYSVDHISCGGTEGEGGEVVAFSTGEEIHQNVSITLPQEDTVMNIQEMAENLKLQDFYIQTLDAFCAISSHSNLEMAQSIVNFFDSEQLMQCLKVSI